VYLYHVFVELYKLLILVSPRIGSSIIRVCPAAHTSLIPIIYGRSPRPCHLEHNSLSEYSLVHALISSIRSHGVKSSDLSVGSRKESGMVVVGQLIHGHVYRWSKESGHVIVHSTLKCIVVAKQISAELVAVLFNTAEEPCDRFHECIIVHDRIPLVTLQPALWITIVLSQNYRIRICLFNISPELAPELVVVLWGMSQIRSHVKSPSICIIWR